MESPYYNLGASLGALIPAIIAHQKRKAFQAQPLGAALGFEGSPAMVPTPGPIRSMPGAGPTIPTGVPTMGPGGNITATPSLDFLGAPANLQPILSQPVGNLMKLKNALGDTQTSNILGSIGVSRAPKDGAMDLEYDEATGTFRLPKGTKRVSSKTANILLRQSDISNKRDIGAWRDAVEKRLSRGQITREEQLSLRADSDLLGFMLDPEFDLLDDTIKQQLQAQALSAVNRLQQRGVKVFTGSRADKANNKPAQPTPGQSQPTVPAAAPEARFNAIKAQNPNLTDKQIYAQMAIEEASQ